MDEQSDNTHNEDAVDATEAVDAPDVTDAPDAVDAAEAPDAGGELPTPPVAEYDMLYPAEHDETSPTKRRFARPLVAGVAAGLVGLGVVTGAVALLGGHDGHDRGDDRGGMTDGRPDHDGPFGDGRMNGQMNGQDSRMGGRDGMQGQQNQQGQQGQFVPPNGGGPMHGNSGGS